MPTLDPPTATADRSTRPGSPTATGTAGRGLPPRRSWVYGPQSALGLTLAVIVILLDQASKLWLIFGYELGRRGLVPLGFGFDLILTWNTGISYGLLQQESEIGRWLLFGFKVVAAVLLTIWLARVQTRLTAVSLGLIIGGAIGNAIDRLAYGAVADFVYFHAAFGPWEFRWYVFNLADVAIVAGVIGLLLDSMVLERAAKAP